jgi:hypothetical protein
MTAALELAKRCVGLLPVHITLVSNQNFFLFTPMLAEAATGAVETRHILYPIRPLCGRWGIEFGEMQVEAVRLGSGSVMMFYREESTTVAERAGAGKVRLLFGCAREIAPGVSNSARYYRWRWTTSVLPSARPSDSPM